MLRLITLLTTFITWNFAAAAWAHPQNGLPHVHGEGNGLTAGLLHPLLGVDHLLAMIAIGLVAAQFASQLKWYVPGCFVGGLMLGGVMGMMGLPFGWAEVGIAISLIALGCALAVGKPVQVMLVLLAAAAFGVMHGHAHGMEVPALASPALYAVGFVLTSIVLHVAGVLLGSWAKQSVVGHTSLRLTGAAVAVVGMFFLAFAR